ncbi:MAG: hypothetical protein L0I24_00245 [Pseudonocardia sp.]|nr:hypothetical protein [Pseudonocardia sp.]
MATTPVFGFRYPTLSDAPNGPAGIENLALDVETQINKTRYGRLTVDQNKTSNTVLADIPGLAFSLAANAEYLMDGVVPIYGLDGSDVKFAFTGPTGMTVSWNPGGPPPTITGASAGDRDYFSAETYGDANTFPVGTYTAAAIHCEFSGYWKTAGTAGTLQLRWAQNTSTAAVTAIRRGSWLRLHRVA